jgi:hypothetical protein
MEDKHADTRDKKREKRRVNAAMRGNRSVYEIIKATERRDRDILAGKRKKGRRA